MGIAGGSQSLQSMRLAGLSAWIAGALSMGLGEYISVASQLDTEAADVEKVRTGGTGGSRAARQGGREAGCSRAVQVRCFVSR